MNEEDNNMCEMTGFDVGYHSDDVAKISPHFCRNLFCDGGMSLDKAVESIAEHYDDVAKLYREKTHLSLSDFIGE